MTMKSQGKDREEWSEVEFLLKLGRLEAMIEGIAFLSTVITLLAIYAFMA